MGQRGRGAQPSGSPLAMHRSAVLLQLVVDWLDSWHLFRLGLGVHFYRRDGESCAAHSDAALLRGLLSARTLFHAAVNLAKGSLISLYSRCFAGEDAIMYTTAFTNQVLSQLHEYLQ